MPTQTVTFREISVRATKSGKCIVCGKRRKRATTFFQTINPFNVKEDGSAKDVYDIMPELQAKVKLWKEEPINCCE